MGWRQTIARKLRFLVRLCLYGLLAMLLGGALAPHAARWLYVLDNFTSFQLQYLAAGAGAAVVALVLREWRAAIVASVLTLIFLSRVAMLLPATGDGAGEGASLKVISANLLFSNGDARRFLEWIDEKDPDIILIQEYGALIAPAVERSLRGEYPHSIAEASDSPKGMAIFSRFPVQKVPLEALRGGGAHEMPAVEQMRKLQRFRVEFNGGLALYNVHPAVPVSVRQIERRNAQFALLAQNIVDETLPVLVAGDLNVTPWSPFYKDFVRSAGLKSARDGKGPMPTWPADLMHISYALPEFVREFLGVPIDYALASASVTFSAFVRGTPNGSDHLPLYFEAHMPAMAKPENDV